MPVDKKSLSESDICAKFITPAVIQAGWDEDTQVRREVHFTKGRIIVRGKLVEQDPNDEPGTELLKRIQTEKSRLVKERMISEPPEFPELSEDEKSYEAPENWAWTRFGNVYPLEYGKNLPAGKRTNTGEYPVYGSNGIVGSHHECCVESPCIVVGRKGSAGALNLSLAKGCWVTDVAYYCIPPTGLDLDFTFKLFHTLRLDNLGKGIKPGLSRKEAYLLAIAVPPLAEQHRIVAKVDELMALCDRLEAQLTTAESYAQRLLDASLYEALQPT